MVHIRATYVFERSSAAKHLTTFGLFGVHLSTRRAEKRKETRGKRKKKGFGNTQSVQRAVRRVVESAVFASTAALPSASVVLPHLLHALLPAQTNSGSGV